MELRTIDHPEANGRQVQPGDVAWEIKLPLENGEDLIVHLGKKSRDLLYGMMIAEEMEDLNGNHGSI